MQRKILITILFICIVCTNYAQENALQKFSTYLKQTEEKENKKLLQVAEQKGWQLQIETEVPNQFATLTGIDVLGRPIYTKVDNNLTSATTTNTTKLWSIPYGLNGSSNNMLNKLAIWDEGWVMHNHIEFFDRIVRKNGFSNNKHSTHVAGTLIASGINPNVKGMAFGAKNLLSFSYNNNHFSEIATNSNNLLISNHSYGIACGWNKNFGGEWFYNGLITDTADYKFGWYDNECKTLDSIAFLAPYYLMVKSAGNSRDLNGPAVGQPFKYLDANANVVVANRPVGLGSNDGYDIIPTYGCAKNLLTVGAIDGNTTTSNNVVMSSFSSWGPTDDGRIKPDIVAAGVDVLSCSSDSTTAYYVNKGTSMSTPNVAGSLFLLQEYYSQKTGGNFMHAATLKALAIHTATEAGIALGPDYSFGWGLLNAEKAIETINNKFFSKAFIIDTTIQNNDTIKFKIVASGNDKLKATLCWTDVPGNATTTNLLNNPSLKLINDIDAKIVHKNKTYLPWCLDPANPSAAAFKANNFRDNVEQVDVDSLQIGDEYELVITHKNVLKNGYQNFSVIITGSDTTKACTPTLANNGNIRIDSFSIINISQTTNSCNSFYNYKNKIGLVSPSKFYPFTLNVSSCNNSNSKRIAKLFIDYNNDKLFDTLTETAFVSNIISGTSVINDSIFIPSTVSQNSNVLMRLVVIETNNPSNVIPCNNNSSIGMVHDYQLQFITPAIDVAITNIKEPSNYTCASKQQFITATITNKGSQSVSNIPLQCVVKIKNTVIATFIDTCKTTINASETYDYTLQTPIRFVTDSNYEISITSSYNNDAISNNNLYKLFFNTLLKSNTVGGTAELCSNMVLLNTFFAPTNASLVWYNSNDSLQPFAVGSSTSSSTLTNKYYITNGIAISVGEKNKNVSNSGGYQIKGGNYFYYNAANTMLLKSAKLYTGNAGKITIIAADTIQTFPNGTYTYQAINSTTINVLASKPIPQVGNINGFDSLDNGLYYNINLQLPKGNHVLIVYADSVASIFRNNNIQANKYPYNVGNAFSLYGNNATNSSSFYYYLYDMQLTTLNCASDYTTIIPTQATKPIIQSIGDSLYCNTFTNYQWQKNGVNIAGATQQGYNTINSGMYSVITTQPNGCIIKSDRFFMPEKKALTIYPNPAKNYINVSLNDLIGNGKIMVTDILGITYLQKLVTVAANKQTEKLNINALPNGTYFLKFMKNDMMLVEKFVVAH